MAEDCLTLNVYVPDGTPGTKGVMVFIHGGGFTAGSAAEYTPSELVTENDVIVVVIQYRLGILGFLSSGDKAAAGNYGLWDQQLALKWVKDNIRAFGGDPDTVTIFGESAGAASVGYQLLSPYSRGLFSGALFQSGTPLSTWGFQKDPRKMFYYLANQTGCLSSTGLADRVYYMMAGGRQQAEHERILSCLKQLNWAKFVALTTLSPFEYGFIGLFAWSPSVDGAFLPRDPAELVGDPAYLESIGATAVNTMLGFNNEEGGLVLWFDALLQARTGAENTFKIDRDFARGGLETEFVYRAGAHLEKDPRRLKLLTDIAEFFYLKPLVDGKAKTKDITDVFSDMWFVLPTIQFAAKLAEARQKAAGRSPTGRLYLYLFNHYPAARAGQELKGMYHGEDLSYQFDSYPGLGRDGFTAEDFALGSTFRSICSNFAKTGDPQLVVDPQTGATWPEFSLDGERYLSLAPTPRVQERLYAKRVALWLDLLPNVFNATQPEVQQTSWTWPWQQQNQQQYMNNMYGYNNYNQQSAMGGGQRVTFTGALRFFKLNR